MKVNKKILREELREELNTFYNIIKSVSPEALTTENLTTALWVQLAAKIDDDESDIPPEDFSNRLSEIAGAVDKLSSLIESYTEDKSKKDEVELAIKEFYAVITSQGRSILIGNEILIPINIFYNSILERDFDIKFDNIPELILIVFNTVRKMVEEKLSEESES